VRVSVVVVRRKMIFKAVRRDREEVIWEVEVRR
jgi:hypothetical protein